MFRKGNKSSGIFLSILFVCVSQATIVVNQWPVGLGELQNVFISCAIKYDGNSLTFPAINGTFVVPEFCPGCDFHGKILGLEYRSLDRPYTEEILEYWGTKFNPKAVIILKEDSVRNRALGHISIDRFGISSERVTFPVLNVGWDFWDAIVEAQAANVTSIEISIDDVGENQILAIMRGWVGPFTIVTHGIWGIANFVLCIRACYLMHLGRNAATVTIALHGIASVLRLIYLIDPFCGWLFPIPFATMIFTMSIPFTLSGCLIITLYWNDMINDTSLSVISFLTTSRWLAGILIPLVVIVEAVTASLRGTVGNVGATVVSGCASETQSETLATTNRPWFHLANNRAVYAVVAILLIILYTWVSIRILRRLSKLARLASNQRLLHRATIRMLLSGGGLLLSLIVSILFITPITHNSIADAMLRWGAYVALNFISTNHILVFERAVSKPRNRKSTIKTPSQSSRSASANTGQG